MVHMREEAEDPLRGGYQLQTLQGVQVLKLCSFCLLTCWFLELKFSMAPGVAKTESRSPFKAIGVGLTYRYLLESHHTPTSDSKNCLSNL